MPDEALLTVVGNLLVRGVVELDSIDSERNAELIEALRSANVPRRVQAVGMAGLRSLTVGEGVAIADTQATERIVEIAQALCRSGEPPILRQLGAASLTLLAARGNARFRVTRQVSAAVTGAAIGRDDLAVGAAHHALAGMDDTWPHEPVDRAEALLVLTASGRDMRAYHELRHVVTALGNSPRERSVAERAARAATGRIAAPTGPDR